MAERPAPHLCGAPDQARAGSRHALPLRHQDAKPAESPDPDNVFGLMSPPRCLWSSSGFEPVLQEGLSAGVDDARETGATGECMGASLPAVWTKPPADHVPARPRKSRSPDGSRIPTAPGVRAALISWQARALSPNWFRRGRSPMGCFGRQTLRRTSIIHRNLFV